MMTQIENTYKYIYLQICMYILKKKFDFRYPSPFKKLQDFADAQIPFQASLNV